ncbi:nascent polypeptide-associated complex protein [Pseudoalteromonas sp. S3260]|uniref:YbaM family protein n=1 Tax=Pseudoalteromonas TaxID=53246 RepID=UPI000975AB4E|nr:MULTISPECIES: YbaM family protein [Pseudoalteromonas]MDN3491081.1 YbaM family protein [Pseudoalteromonas sp. APC 3694]TMO92394.1 nascent polypeptide-associated complex protein [Pseudoalteromonas sp. S3260]
MSNPLEDAPTHIKLAVDLIMILEQHDVEPEEVLKALDIVKSDFEKKLVNLNSG